LDADCKSSDILLSKSRLEIRARKKKAVMLGNIYGDKQTVKLICGEIAPLKFIFDPTPFAKDLGELCRIFTGPVYSLELYDFEGKKIGQIDSKRIKEIRTISSKKIYAIKIPLIADKDEALRIMDILKANDIGGIELEERRTDEDFFIEVKNPSNLRM